MKTTDPKNAHRNRLHALKGILETSLQIAALASLVHRIGAKRAMRVAAVVTEAYLAGRY